MKDKEYLEQLVKLFREAYREGNEIDDPEGVRIVKISDTMLTQITDKLEMIADRM